MTLIYSWCNRRRWLQRSSFVLGDPELKRVQDEGFDLAWPIIFLRDRGPLVWKFLYGTLRPTPKPLTPGRFKSCPTAWAADVLLLDRSPS